jgi:hypothetical protein
MTRGTSIAEADTPELTGRERVLVNFFYAQNVGHAVEAMHCCLGHYLADPSREICVALNAATPVEIAGFCPFVSQTFAVDHPLLDRAGIRSRDSPGSLLGGTGCSMTSVGDRPCSSRCFPVSATITRRATAS